MVIRDSVSSADAKSRSCQWDVRRRLDATPAFGGEADVLDVFTTMLAEAGKSQHNPLRLLSKVRKPV